MGRGEKSGSNAWLFSQSDRQCTLVYFNTTWLFWLWYNLLIWSDLCQTGIFCHKSLIFTKLCLKNKPTRVALDFSNRLHSFQDRSLWTNSLGAHLVSLKKKKKKNYIYSTPALFFIPETNSGRKVQPPQAHHLAKWNIWKVSERREWGSVVLIVAMQC